MSRDLNSWLLPQNSSGYIVGFRGWMVQETRLDSLCQTCIWPTNHPLECEIPLLEGVEGTYDVKGWNDERVGIFAFKTLRQLQVCQLSFYFFGEVAFWGEVVEHERGYRAQYAYPLTLTQSRMCPYTHQGEGPGLAELYGCKYIGELS